MPPIILNISVKHKKEVDNAINSLMNTMALTISKDVTKYLHDESKKLASGGNIPKVENHDQKDKIETHTSLAEFIEMDMDGIASDNVQSTVTSTKDYSSYVEYGTGLYGPERKLIVASEVGNRKNVFVFEWKGQTFFLPYTKGQYPKPFMRGSIYKLRQNLNNILKGKK